MPGQSGRFETVDGQQAFHSFFVYNTAFVKFKKDLLCVHLLKAFMRSLAKIKNTLFFVPWALAWSKLPSKK